MINLKDAIRYSVNDVGNKAYNLSRLISYGVNVKDGIILTDQDVSDRLINLESSGFFCGRCCLFAVRSSAVGEDGLNFSWAGQFLSLLNVSMEDLPDAIFRVISHAQRDISLSSYSRFSNENSPRLAVLIQEMVIPSFSGIIFTRNPINGSNEMIIEVVSGLGESLASGKKTPNKYTFNCSKRQLEVSSLASFDIDRTLLIDLVDLAQSIKEFFGCDQDIEFSIEVSSKKIFINQSRPITTNQVMSSLPLKDSNSVGLKGISASTGLVRGQVVIAKDAQDTQAMELLSKHSILVTRFTEPTFLPMLLKLIDRGALLTEVGGMLSHAAIIARELGIPCVVGIPNITSSLCNGQLVEVDAHKGIVRILD